MFDSDSDRVGVFGDKILVQIDFYENSEKHSILEAKSHNWHKTGHCGPCRSTSAKPAVRRSPQ